MSSNETKHVQTELSEDEYEQFRRFAEEQGLSLKEAGHEAVTEWVERKKQPNPDDPAFTVLDELDDSATVQTDARTEEDVIEEWHGSDESFVLADEPSSHS
jgi:hypothetical protein